MEKHLNVMLACCLFFILHAQAPAQRTLLVLQIDRGPGATTEEAAKVMDRVENVLKAQGLFTVSPRADLLALVAKMGGCARPECYYSTAKETGVQLLVTGSLRRQRDVYQLTLNIIDTDFGEAVMEISEDLPKGATDVTEQWLTPVLAQLEPLTMAAEAVEGAPAEDDFKLFSAADTMTPKAPDTAAAGDTAAPKAKPQADLAPSGMGLAAERATLVMDDELSGKLTREKSPYLIVKNLTVPAGQTLEIEPGVTLLMGGDRIALVVFGQVMANGTKKAPVVFRSAKKDPGVGDWDRVYVRGSMRSCFTGCRFSHSQSGVHADNGSVLLTNCRFVNNAACGVYAFRSDVRIRDTDIGKGHLTGIHADAGSEVLVDSGSIVNNNRAVVCHPYARLRMEGTRIENNDIGIVLAPRADVRLTDVLIRDNRVGVMARKEIPAGRLFRISGNGENVRVADEADFRPLMTAPGKITGVKARETALTDTAGFQADFSSLPPQGGTLADRLGLLGRVSAGLSYRGVTDMNAENHPSLAEAELPHQSSFVPGLRPEFQVFMQSRTGDRESNLTLNGYGNYYSERLQAGTGNANLACLESYRALSRFEVMNLSTKMPGREIVLGDFWQDKSGLSISGRQVRGLRYGQEAKFSGGRAFAATALIGQSAAPWAAGLKPDMLDSSLTPERQEWLAMADASVRVGRGLSLTAHAIGARHVDDPILFPGLHMDSLDLYGADAKLRSVSWGGGARYDVNRNLSVYGEMDGGFADTLSVNVDPGAGNRRGFSADTVIHHDLDENNAAGLAGLDYSISGFSGNVEYLRAQRNFFTAGNPSIRPPSGDLNKLRFTGSRAFRVKALSGGLKSVELSTGFDWEGAGTEQGGIGTDTLGRDAIVPSAADDDFRTFAYEPVENRFKGGLALKVGLWSLSVEPEFSYYYETRTLLKRDAKSRAMTVAVDGFEKTVTATEYTDAESRLRTGGSLVFTPALNNKLVSGLRFRLSPLFIFTDDRRDEESGEPDSSWWDREDGLQYSLDFSAAAGFFKKRAGNRLYVSYRNREKEYRDELRVTTRVADRFTCKIIPRKLDFYAYGYYTKTTVDYREALLDADGVFLGAYQPVSEELTVYGGEGSLTLSLSGHFSVSGKGGYELGRDTAERGGENYTTFFAGTVLSWMF